VSGRASVSDRAFLVKVCGLTRLEDVRLAVRYGANALGFNFHPGSPRHVTVEDARRMSVNLPRSVLKVGVVVVPSRRAAGLGDLGDLLGRLEAFVDALQVHGAEREGDLPVFAGRTIVAVSPETAHLFPENEVIIDTSWGTGRLADWDAVGRIGRPFILSGGLTADNVTDAVRRLRPAGVDVCSGVEAEPGRKDPVKLRRFLERVAGGGAVLVN
jgi:phosphoribosylanthranilate isomerase